MIDLMKLVIEGPIQQLDNSIFERNRFFDEYDKKKIPHKRVQLVLICYLINEILV